MAGVVRFFRDPKNNDQLEYKIGKIRDLNYQEFKYYELSRTDVAKNGNLTLNIDNSSKTICTSVDIEFNTEYILIIDSHPWVIRTIYEELDPDDNNFFNITPRKRTYLTIIRDR